ncbi:MAG TPA: hypothetical protein DDW87_11065 [Firmicutes bacterium]|nr:hypothetical protein [Bacillota bacterium]
MPSETPKFTIRMPRELLDKIAFIAEQNGRSTNREIEILVKKQIAAYEKENGVIVFHESETIAAHRADNPMDDVPQEAWDSIQAFKKSYRDEKKKRDKK